MNLYFEDIPEKKIRFRFKPNDCLVVVTEDET